MAFCLFVITLICA